MDNEEEIEKVLLAMVVLSPAGIDAWTLARHFQQLFGKTLPFAIFPNAEYITFLRELCGDLVLFQGPKSCPILTIHNNFKQHLSIKKRSVNNNTIEAAKGYDNNLDQETQNFSPGVESLDIIKTAVIRHIVFALLKKNKEVECCSIIRIVWARYRFYTKHALLMSLAKQFELFIWGQRFSNNHWKVSLSVPPAPPLPKQPSPRRPLPPSYDEALPFVPYEKGVFPEDCIHYTERIPSVGIEDLRVNDNIDVIAAEVYTPWHMWLIRVGAEHIEALEKMMFDMNKYYNHEGSTRFMCYGAVIEGHHVACCYENEWHRAQIVKLIDYETVLVKYIDFGTVQVVMGRDLRPLLRCWTDLPAQAVSARLFASPPASPCPYFHTVAAHYMLHILKGQTITATVTAINHNEQFITVCLRNKSQEVCNHSHENKDNTEEHSIPWSLQESYIHQHEINRYKLCDEESVEPTSPLINLLSEDETSQLLQWLSAQNLTLKPSPNENYEDPIPSQMPSASSETDSSQIDIRQGPRFIKF